MRMGLINAERREGSFSHAGKFLELPLGLASERHTRLSMFKTQKTIHKTYTPAHPPQSAPSA
jgi:hypothetical protein